MRLEGAPEASLAQIESRAVPRSTLIRLFAAMIVLTVVTAIPMTQIHWNGEAA